MQISVGNMSKRVNSTKQAFTVKNTFDVKLKEKTSIMNPVFILDKSYDEDVNYLSCKWGYYWIIDVVHVTANIIEIYAKRDYLATHKTWIGYSKGWFSLGEEAYWNKYIDDSRFDPEVEFYHDVNGLPAGGSHSVAKVNSPWINTSIGGYYVVRCQSTSGGTGNPSDTTGVNTYLCDMSALRDIYAGLYASVNQEYPNGQTLDESFAKEAKGLSVSDVTGQLKSIYWCPFNITIAATALNLGSATHSFNIGPYKLTISNGSMYLVTNNNGIKNVYEESVTLPIDTLHTNLPWLKAAKYYKVTLCHPGGSMDISSDSYIADNGNKIVIKEAVNYLTGEYAFQAFIDNNDIGNQVPLGASSGNLGCDVTGMLSVGLAPPNGNKFFSANKTARTGMLATVGGVVAGAAKGFMTGGIGGAIAGGVIGGVVGAVGADKSIDAKMAARTPTAGNTTVSGTCAAHVCYDRNAPFRIVVEGWKPAMIEDFTNDYAPYCNLYGWPTRKYGQLDTIGAGTNGSYVQGIDVDIGTAYAAATDPQPTIEELNAINSVINSGLVFE